ncbi:MAG: riboflavin biosynthesis protein RibF [Anaerolineae bacterium]|nr:riboflavin biosynthesis protein RibF [Anaerolineae bacterium]
MSKSIDASISSGVTIGAFDGVHLGHQALIHSVVENAHGMGVQAVAVTFDPLPRQVLGRAVHTMLSDIEERVDLLGHLGLDGVIVLPFNQQMVSMPAQAFVEFLVHRLGMRHLWAGADFALGHRREGDIAYLTTAGREKGFTVHLFDKVVQWQGVPVRSSRVRQALQNGNLDEANGCLGRPYRLSGVVGYGDRRGHTLGFPTANLDLPEARLRPANGVYICRAHLTMGSFNALTNVGTRPTFNNRPPTVEAHLLNFSANIYGEQIKLDFLHYLRPEIKFSSVDVLVKQMQQDELMARDWLDGRIKPLP